MTNESNSEEPIFVRQSLQVRGINFITIAVPIIYLILVYVVQWPPVVRTYLQFGEGVATCTGFYLMFLLFSLYYFFLGKSITLYSDRVEWGRRFRKKETYYLKDMKGWSYFENSDDKLTRIYLVFPERSILISESDSLEELQSYLIEHKFPWAEREQFHYTGSQWVIIGFALLFFLMIMSSGYAFYHIASPLKERHKGAALHRMIRLVTDRKAAWTQKDGVPDDIIFHMEGLDSLSFIAYNSWIGQYYDGLPAGYNAEHDTVTIDIAQYDYELYIAHTREPTFLDKHVDWQEIQIDSIYLMLNDRFLEGR